VAHSAMTTTEAGNVNQC